MQNFKEFLEEQKTVIKNSILELQDFMKDENNKSPTRKENVKEVIESIIVIYQNMKHLVPSQAFPSRELIQKMFEDTFHCLKMKKDEEIKSFFNFLNWIKDMIENLSNDLLKIKENREEIEKLKDSLEFLKEKQKKLNLKEEEEEKIPTESYTFEKLDEKINDIFSEYGERRWIFIVTLKTKEHDKVEEKKIYNILANLKWKQDNNYFLSPTPIYRGEESLQVEKLLKNLRKENLHSPKSYNLNLYCTIGKIELDSQI